MSKKVDRPDFRVFHSIHITRPQLIDILRSSGMPLPDGDGPPNTIALFTDGDANACGECDYEPDAAVFSLTIRWWGEEEVNDVNAQ